MGCQNMISGCVKFVSCLYFVSQLHVATSIIGGKKAKRSEWPSLVPIDYAQNRYYCSGSILMAKWIMTAARCVDKKFIQGSVIGIRLNVNNLELDGGTLVRQIALYIHPMFYSDLKSGTSVNDIAVMELEKSIEFTKNIYPMPIGFEPLEKNVQCKAAGWGAVSDRIYLNDAVYPEFYYPWRNRNVLREVGHTTADITMCKALMPVLDDNRIHEDYHECSMPINKTEIPSNTTRPVNRDSDGPAHGDFGGPLVCNNHQVGIFIFPVHTHNLKNYKGRSVWTPSARHVRWMEKVVKEYEKPKEVPSYTDSVQIDLWAVLSHSSRISLEHLTLFLLLFL